MTKIGKTPFIGGEIVPGDATEATVTYGTGFNCSGTNQAEVLQHVRHPDGTEFTYVIMRGLSRTKAAAVAMILSAPEV